MAPRNQRPTINLWNRFTPLPSQKRFFESRAFGRLFSSGYGSGKSLTGCREGIRWAVTYPGSRGLIGRLVGDELKTTTMVTFWKSMAVIGFREGRDYIHNKAEREITFTLHKDPLWQSKILYRHLDDPNSLGSLEINWAFIDEGAEVDDMIYKTLSSSRLRWHLPNCNHQEEVERAIRAGATDEEIAAIPCSCPRGIWVCTNPGGSSYLEAVTQGKVPRWDWIKAKPGENPYNGPEYYAKMQEDAAINGSEWMKMFYDGEWGVVRGMRFPMFSDQRHIMPAPFRPTSDYEILEGWDFGHRETFVVWIAWKPNGVEPVVVFEELQVNEVHDPAQVANKVKQIRAEYGIADRVQALGDPAGIAASQFSSIGPITAYAGHNIFIAPCKVGKSPTGRADHIAKLLNQNKLQPDRSEWPGLVFGPNCPAVVSSLKKLRWKPVSSKLGEDSREGFIKKDDHGVDALGYALVAVPPPEVDPPPRPRDTSLGIGGQTALREWLASTAP